MSKTLVIIKTNIMFKPKDLERLYNDVLHEMQQGLILLPAGVSLEAVIHSDEKILYIKDEAGRHIFPPLPPGGTL